MLARSEPCCQYDRHDRRTTHDVVIIVRIAAVFSDISINVERRIEIGHISQSLPIGVDIFTRTRARATRIWKHQNTGGRVSMDRADPMADKKIGCSVAVHAPRQFVLSGQRGLGRRIAISVLTCSEAPGLDGLGSSYKKFLRC